MKKEIKNPKREDLYPLILISCAASLCFLPVYPAFAESSGGEKEKMYLPRDAELEEDSDFDSSPYDPDAYVTMESHGLSLQRGVSYSFFAGGGVVLVAGGFVGLSARRHERDIAERINKSGMPLLSDSDAFIRADQKARQANIFFTMGAGMTLVGITLLLIDILILEDDFAAASFQSENANLFPLMFREGGGGFTLRLNW